MISNWFMQDGQKSMVEMLAVFIVLTTAKENSPIVKNSSSPIYLRTHLH